MDHENDVVVAVAMGLLVTMGMLMYLLPLEMVTATATYLMFAVNPHLKVLDSLKYSGYSLLRC